MTHIQPRNLDVIDRHIDTESSSVSIRAYLKEIGDYPLLTPEQEQSLVREVKRGNAQARQKFIECNLRLVVAIAKNYSRNDEHLLLDLIQEGNLGLMKAVEKYDPDRINPQTSRPYRFSTMATNWIAQAIQRSIPEHYRFIPLPTYRAEQLKRVKKLVNELADRLGHEPTLSELTSAIGMTESEVYEILSWDKEPVSLDIPLEQDDYNGYSLADYLPDPSYAPDLQAAQSILCDQVQAALSRLDTRARKAVAMRYGLDGYGDTWSLEEVSEEIGVTRERVRQIVMKALKTTLKTALEQQRNMVEA